jgi:hypothetical protein
MRISPMQHMVNTMNVPSTRHSVRQRDYDLWRRGFVFEALRNRSYGQSFCEHFGIRDYIITSLDNVRDCHEYINQNYLRD